MWRNVASYRKSNRNVYWWTVNQQILISYVHYDGGYWSESALKLSKIMLLIRNVINVCTMVMEQETKLSPFRSSDAHTMNVTSHCFVWI